MSEIEIEVFVHSHFQTGEPIEVGAFTAQGHIDLVWFFHVFDKEHMYHRDLATQIHEIIGCTEELVWIKCEPNNDGMPKEWWIKSIELLKN